jgi:hypothetical protein
MRTRYVPIFLLILSTPVHAYLDCTEDIKKLLWLESANAEMDAKKAIQAGNLNLKGVRGIAIYIPGVDQEEGWRLSDAGKVDIIEGTSDHVCAGKHDELDKLATAYATRYNKIILGNQ